VHSTENHQVTKIEEPFINLRKLYQSEIKKAKQENWKNLIAQSKPWSSPYEIFWKKKEETIVQLPLTAKGGHTTYNLEEANTIILQENFPDTKITENPPFFEINNITELFPEVENEINSINLEHIKYTLKTRNNKSTPGLEEIRYSHLKAVHKKHPNIYTN